MNGITEAFVTIAIAVIGLATVSVIVSRNANTTGVANSLFSGLSKNIATAVSPVTSGSSGMSLGVPSYGDISGGFGG